jgi:predicted ArsR family transcriptional regulator
MRAGGENSITGRLKAPTRTGDLTQIVTGDKLFSDECKQYFRGGMQQTRRFIIDILRERGEATVDDIVSDLQQRRGKEITAVTVRHHLTRLQEDNMIASPQMRHRSTPGRPQHVYALTDKAFAQFPNNYQRLATGLLQGMRRHLHTDHINVILEDVADLMVMDASIPRASVEQRLAMAVDYLTRQGYEAYWEPADGGYTLFTSNCPYHHIAQGEATLCEMDMRLVAGLLGAAPRRLSHVLAGDTACAYFIPANNIPANNGASSH